MVTITLMMGILYVIAIIIGKLKNYFFENVTSIFLQGYSSQAIDNKNSTEGKGKFMIAKNHGNNVPHTPSKVQFIKKNNVSSCYF